MTHLVIFALAMAMAPLKSPSIQSGRCSACVFLGVKGRTYPATTGTMTLMAHQPYYDESGVYHNHNPNRFSSSWSCSNGHCGGRSILIPCSAAGCDYGMDSR